MEFHRVVVLILVHFASGAHRHSHYNSQEDQTTEQESMHKEREFAPVFTDEGVLGFVNF